MVSGKFNNWMVLTFNGIIAILYGLMAMFVSRVTLLSIVMYFGIVILIIGLAMLFGVVNNMKNNQPYAGDMTFSIITIVIGGLLTFYTQKSLEIFVIVIGSWAILLGILQLYLFINTSFGKSTKNVLLVNGLITLALGVILFFNPFKTAQALVIVSGVLSFILGVILISLSVKFKNMPLPGPDQEI
ncbi:MAG: hypothetical protein C0598_14595 [Marinilabiliales bacterium]|nr:MAG: hypothetical protein C0598_14595 [Marinilabiliales bacterium]